MRLGFRVVWAVSAAVSVLFSLGFPHSADAQPRSLFMPAMHTVESPDSSLALSNTGAEAASVTLIARGYDGTILEGTRANPVTFSLPSASSKILKPRELFGENIPPSWIEVQTASPAISGSFFLSDPSLPAMDASTLVESGSNRLIFPKVVTDGSANTLVFVNASPRKIAQVGITLFNNLGQLVTQRYISLAPYAGFSGGIADLMPDIETFDGYAVVDAASDTGSDVLIGFETWRGTSDLAAISAIPETDRYETGHIAHFASQGGYDSTLVLLNYNGDPQTISITAGALEDDGKPSAVPSQTVQLTLGNNQRLEARLDELFNFPATQMTTGFVRYQTQNDSTGLYGYLELKTSSGRLATVPVQGDGYSNSSFSYQVDGGGNYTALALLNPGLSSSTVQLAAFDLRGRSIGETTFSLEPNGHWSRLLKDVFPQTANQNGGSVRISSSGVVLAVELLGSTASSGTLAVLPAQRDIQDSQRRMTLVPTKNGGTVTSRDGTTTLTVPAGSLPQDAALRVAALSVDDFPKPAGERLMGIVQGAPSGTQFRNPVRLRFPLAERLQPGSILPVSVFNPVTRQYDASDFTATVDATGEFASADVTHFSIFAVANSPVKAPLAVSAGADQAIRYPDAASLRGTVTDDGVPQESGFSVNWVKVSGPGSVVIVHANSLNASASFLAPGTYILKMTVSRGALHFSDEVNIVVK
jgi:hypothetical protein